MNSRLFAVSFTPQKSTGLKESRIFSVFGDLLASGLRGFRGVFFVVFLVFLATAVFVFPDIPAYPRHSSRRTL
jgi:hypothetical protein